MGQVKHKNVLHTAQPYEKFNEHTTTKIPGLLVIDKSRSAALEFEV